MRTALLFLLAIATPCGVMAWLSWRSMHAEAELVERQRIAYYQQSADAAAVEAARWIGEQIAGFTATVDALLQKEPPEKLAVRFDAALRESWPLAQAGVVLDAGGAPIDHDPPAERVTAFLTTNGWLTSGATDWYFRSENEAVQRFGAVGAVYDTDTSRGMGETSKWDLATLDGERRANRRTVADKASADQRSLDTPAPVEREKAVATDRPAGLAGGFRGPESENLTETRAGSQPPPAITLSNKPEPRGQSQSLASKPKEAPQLQPPPPPPPPTPAAAPAAPPADPEALSDQVRRRAMLPAPADRVALATAARDDVTAATVVPSLEATPEVAALSVKPGAAAKSAPEPAATMADEEARKTSLYKSPVKEKDDMRATVRLKDEAKKTEDKDAGLGFGALAAPIEAFQEAASGKSAAPRTVQPRHLAPGDPTTPLPSRVQPALTTLAILAEEEPSGLATHAGAAGRVPLMYYRPPQCAEFIFTAALDNAALRSAVQSLHGITAPDDDTLLAVMDEQARPVAQWKGFSDHAHAHEQSQRSWTTPLVAREIGALLPQWETAVFLRHPDVFAHAAGAARWRLGIIVSAAALAALAGAFFILRDARRIALEARQKTDFVSSVSHELKTPLTSIRMFSDLLAASPEAPPEKTQRYAEVISSEAARLSRLITNVLNFSRLERGEQKLHLSLLDLRDLTSETADHYRPQLEKAGFAVEVMLPSHPVTVRADRDALSQVILNLLSNAEKYGHAPDRPHALTINLTTAGAWVGLSVLDRGPGVPRGHEQRIFRKFHRAHDMLTNGAAGSGLGLTIAQKLASAHGGRIEYAPREGGGASFTLTLPLSS